MSSLPICIWPTFINLENNCENLKVNDLITGNISMRPIVKHPILDQLTWDDSSSKKSTLKDLYLLVEPPHVISEKAMDWIWKLKVPLRVKFFWWKVQWGRLPCKSFLLFKNLIDQNIACCDLCLASLEDMTHVLIPTLLLPYVGAKSRNFVSISACLNQFWIYWIFFQEAIVTPSLKPS